MSRREELLATIESMAKEVRDNTLEEVAVYLDAVGEAQIANRIRRKKSSYDPGRAATPDPKRA